MKSLSQVFCATLLMASFYACKKSDGPPPQLTVDRSAVSLGVFQGYTDSFEIQSAASWELQVSPASAAQWMQVSATQGVAGKTVVKVRTIAANTTTQTATLSINPAGRSTPKVEVTVTQKIYAEDWKKMIGGDDRDEINSMAKTPDGGLVIAGSTLSDANGDIGDNHGYYDAFVMKLNAAGAIVWKKNYGGNSLDLFSSIAVTADGGFIASGLTENDNDGDVPANNGYVDVWVVRLDANGTIVWSKCFGGTDYDISKSVAVTPDGGFVVVAETDSDNTGDVGHNNGYTDLWVFKLNQSGNIVWNKLLGGDGSEHGSNVVANADGSSVIAAVTYSNNSGNVGATYGETDGWVLKLDANGNIVWNKTYGGLDFDELFSITPAADGFVLAGYSESNNNGDVGDNNGSADAWVFKIDASGNKVWSKTYGGQDWDELRHAAVTPEGDLVLTGFTESDETGDIGTNHGFGDIWMLKLNKMGDKLWTKMLGGSQHEYGPSVLSSGNGEIIIGGNTFSSNNGDVGASHGDYDVWLVKFK